MRKKMKRKLGLIVLVVIFLMALISLIVVLVATKTELVAAQAELKETQDALNDMENSGQIEALLLAAVTFYTEGQIQESYRLFDYAIEKMANQQGEYINVLPRWLFYDSIVANKFGLKKEAERSSRRFGGG